MKEILKNLGLIIIIIGVVFLSIVVFKESHNNTKLGISLVLVVVGFFTHILINKYID